MKKCNLNLLILFCITLFILSCEKEKIVQDTYIHSKLLASSDTININENETKSIYLSITPPRKSKYQVISYPNWVTVTPDSGTINEDIQEVKITANLQNMPSGVFTDKVIIMSSFGYDTITVIGRVGEQILYNLPDTIHIEVFSDVQNFNIQNLGNVELNVNILNNVNYLELPTNSGNIKINENKNFKLNINRANLEVGFHISELHLTINDIRDTIIVKTEHFIEQKLALTTDIIDAEYCKLTDKLVYISSNSKLNIYDTKTGINSSVSLDYLPNCLALSNDGSMALIGHDGRVTLIDIQNKEIIKTLDVSCNAIDVVLGDNNWAYVFPKQDQWSEIRCLDLNLNNPIESFHTGISIYAGTKAKLHPSGKYIYGADNGVSPSDLEKYDIRNGRANYMYDSPYHGDYAVSGNLWFSEDGNRIFTSGKNVFKTSEIKEQDMIYNGSISISNSTNSFYSTKISFLNHSDIKKHLYIIVGENNLNRSKVFVYNSNNLVYMHAIELEKFLVKDNSGGGKFYDAEPYFVFSNSTGNEIFVFTKAIKSGLQHEWALQKIKIE